MKPLYTLPVMLMLLIAVPVFAGSDQLIKLNTRPDVTVSVYYMKRDAAKATVVLLTGGAGGIGMKDGVPMSRNFLVRSRDYFASHGFNVAVVNKPSDISDSWWCKRHIVPFVVGN